MSGVSVMVLAAELLRDAAAFFEGVAEQNPDLDEAMRGNADVYRRVAEQLDADPGRRLVIGDEGEEGPPVSRLALRLLHDAADFMDNAAAQNPQFADELLESAGVYRSMAELAEADPQARLPVDS